MSEQARYFRVGLFVLVGMVLLTAALITLGGRGLFREPIIFETYLSESVQGLEVGSPVKFRGVQLGSVSYIGLVGDRYVFDTVEDEVLYGRLVLVEMKLSQPTDVGDREPPTEEERKRNLEMRVNRGLRLRLSQQGITGLAYLEADFVPPKANPPMKITWTPDHLYVPSVPSTLKGLTTAVERTFQRLADLDVEGLVTHLDELLVGLKKMADDLDLGSLADEAERLLTDLRATSASLRRAMEDAEVAKLASSARTTIDELSEAVAEVETLIQDSRYDLQATLENLRVVTEDLRDVASNAKSYPSFILLGQPPEESKVISPK